MYIYIYTAHISAHIIWRQNLSGTSAIAPWRDYRGTPDVTLRLGAAICIYIYIY